VLVELPNLRSDCARIEVGTGEAIKRRDDACVAGVANVAATKHLRQRPHIVDAHITGPRFQRYDER
jgi:hypothetical protein